MKTNSLGSRAFILLSGLLFSSIAVVRADVVVVGGMFLNSSDYTPESTIGSSPLFITGLDTDFTFTSTNMTGRLASNPLVVTFRATDTKGGGTSDDLAVTTGLVRRGGIGVGDGAGVMGAIDTGYDEYQTDETLTLSFNHDVNITAVDMNLFAAADDRQLWQVGAGPVYTFLGGGTGGGDIDFAIDTARTGGAPTTGLVVAIGETLTIRGGASGPSFSTADGTQFPASGDGVVAGFTMDVTAIPEPSSVLLLGCSGVFILLRRRRHQKRSRNVSSENTRHSWWHTVLRLMMHRNLQNSGAQL